MAEVYRRTQGAVRLPIQKAMGHTREAQKAIGTEGAKIGAKARSNLARHRHDGHARIEVETGDMDVWITLNDERGMGAAMSIEFGRSPYVDENGNEIGGMQGLGVLREAAGLLGEAP